MRRKISKKLHLWVGPSRGGSERGKSFIDDVIEQKIVRDAVCCLG